MPYVTAKARLKLRDHEGSTLPTNPGNLNFVICRLVDRYLAQFPPSYVTLNEVIGVLECAKIEVYRRLVVPYEESKMLANGDVFVEGEMEDVET